MTGQQGIRRGIRQYSLAALLLTLSVLSVPLAVFRSGAVLTACCLLYAAIVFPILWDVCRRKVAELENQTQASRRGDGRSHR